MKNKREHIDNYKNDFIESWNLIEQFYSEYPDSDKPFKNDALRLINEMRDLGIDEKLRVGQSLWFFLLSRNRNYGLDKEPHIRIAFLGNNKMSINSNLYGEEINQESEVKYSGYLEKMINKLLEKKIIWNEYGDDDFDLLFNSLDND